MWETIKEWLPTVGVAVGWLADAAGVVGLLLALSMWHKSRNLEVDVEPVFLANANSGWRVESEFFDGAHWPCVIVRNRSDFPIHIEAIEYVAADGRTFGFEGWCIDSGGVPPKQLDPGQPLRFACRWYPLDKLARDNVRSIRVRLGSGDRIDASWTSLQRADSKAREMNAAAKKAISGE